MKATYLYMPILFFISQGSIAGTFTYFKELSKMSGAEAIDNHLRIEEISNKLSFLDCPIELIERQWDKIASVTAGIEYFQQFMRESEKAAPDYKSIEVACLETLTAYRNNDKRGFSHAGGISRAQSDELYRRFSKLGAAKEDALINELISKLNQDTLCYTEHVALHAAVFLGFSVGRYQMECFTPLGRRFKLKGPSIGSGMGVGAGLSLPKGGVSKNSLAFRFKLYKLREQSRWYVSHSSTTYALGAGVAIEAQHYPRDKDSMIHGEDNNPSVGMSVYVEDLYNFMRKKHQSPFYMSLVSANLLDDMAS